MGLISLIAEHLESLCRRAGEERAAPQSWLELFSAHRRKLATLAMVTLALLFAYHVVFGMNGMLAYRHKRREYRQLQMEIHRLEEENRQLAEQNKALRSDPEAIEREAREQLRYARPEDIVVVLPGKQPEPPTSDASAQRR
jgi:cell division protein FtsB